MAKVINLLAKMGLVYSDTAAPLEPPAAEPEVETEAPTTRLAAPPGGADPPASRLAPPRRDPALEAAVAQAAEVADYPFDQIYSSAGIKDPEHGFTVFKLIEMMEAEELRGLDDPTRARVVGGMLRRLPNGPIAVADIVRDAVHRDQALDAFEQFLAERARRAEEETVEANRALQAEVDELVKRNGELMRVNQDRVEAEQAKLERFRERKRAEEDRLFAAVQPFVDPNPVTRSEPTAPDEQPTSS